MAATRALLLSRTAYRESDLIVQFFTEDRGRLSALARGARRSQRRFAGALEPFHGLVVDLTPPRRGDLHDLLGARLDRPRLRLSESWPGLQVAGEALRYLRAVTEEHSPDGVLYEKTEAFLSSLDTCESPELVGAEFGLYLLRHFGWGLELGACVRCGRPCPPHRAATVSIEHGGVVCSPCGGAPLLLTGKQRERLQRALAGDTHVLESSDAQLARSLVARTFASHAQLEPALR